MRGCERPPDLWLLKLRSAGMFSNVNEVVEQLRRAEAGGYRFVIDWSASTYRDPDVPGDPWGYYFHPCFAREAAEFQEAGGDLSMLPVLPGGWYLGTRTRRTPCCV